MVAGGYRGSVQQELVCESALDLLRDGTDVRQHDLVPELQVHLPDQGIGDVRKTLWRRGDERYSLRSASTFCTREDDIASALALCFPSDIEACSTAGSVQGFRIMLSATQYLRPAEISQRSTMPLFRSFSTCSNMQEPPVRMTASADTQGGSENGLEAAFLRPGLCYLRLGREGIVNPDHLSAHPVAECVRPFRYNVNLQSAHRHPAAWFLHPIRDKTPVSCKGDSSSFGPHAGLRLCCVTVAYTRATRGHRASTSTSVAVACYCVRVVVCCATTTRTV